MLENYSVIPVNATEICITTSDGKKRFFGDVSDAKMYIKKPEQFKTMEHMPPEQFNFLSFIRTVYEPWEVK